MRRRVLCLALLLFPSFAVSEESSKQSCNHGLREEILEEKVATAGKIANIRGAEGSISYESKRLLKLATDRSMQYQTDPKPLIVFKSIPKKFLTDYSDQAHCTELESQTQKQPFIFPEKEFENAEEVANWFGEFSQGSGKDGEELYKRCDQSCSPQYTLTLIPAGNKLRLQTSVICGQARDTWNNEYLLSAMHRWECPAEEKSIAILNSAQ
jgi:hypothetical protein